MACGGCRHRGRVLMVFATRVYVATTGRPIPRRVLDVMTGVRCNTCGFIGEGVTFGWDEKAERGFCMKCDGDDLALGTASRTL